MVTHSIYIHAKVALDFSVFHAQRGNLAWLFDGSYLVGVVGARALSLIGQSVQAVPVALNGILLPVQHQSSQQ